MSDSQMTWVQRLFHVALLAGSAYIAANPKYAWAIPLIQGVGQALPQPK